MSRLLLSLSTFVLLAVGATPGADDWATPINLSQSLLSSDGASLAVDGQGKVLVSWSEDMGTQVDIFYSVQETDGWTPPAAIAETPGYSGCSSLAAGQGGAIHAVWDDSSPGLNSLVYSVWDGQSWTSPVSILPDPRSINCPRVAVDSTGSPHVVWQDWSDGQIYHSVKSAAGWSQPQVISLYDADPDSTYFLPQLAAGEEDKVYVVWYGSSYSHSGAFFAGCAAAVCTMGAPIPAADGANNPAIAVDGLGRLHVIWNHGDVYYSRSDDGGISWSPPEPLPALPGTPYSKAIRTDNFNRPHVVWEEEVEVGDAQVAYVAWTGASWSAPVRLSIGPEAYVLQSLAIDAYNQVHVAWTEWMTDTGEILYAARSDLYPRVYLPLVLR